VIASGTAIGGASTLWEPPQGLRLSLTTNVYVTTIDVTAAGTLYWTTVISGGTGVVTGYNGSSIARKTVQQKSISVTMTSGKIKNVYYDYDGDALALGADWTDDVTPSETIADEQGAPVLSSDHTKLLIGVVRASGTNVIEDSEAKRFVYNKYNQVHRMGKRIDATGHAYSSSTARYFNNDTANKIEILVGEPQSVGYALYGDITGAVNGLPAIYGLLDWASGPGDSNDAVFGYFVSGLRVLDGTRTAKVLTAGYHFISIIEVGDFSNTTNSTFNATRIIADLVI
jgi:hypothetical protein